MGCASSAAVKEPTGMTPIGGPPIDNQTPISGHSSFGRLQTESGERAVSVLTLKSGQVNMPGDTAHDTPQNLKRDVETRNGTDFETAPKANGMAIPKRMREEVTRFTSLSVPTSPLVSRIREKQDALDGRASALGISGEKSAEDTQVQLNKALKELSRSLSESHGSIFHIDTQNDDAGSPQNVVQSPGSPPGSFETLLGNESNTVVLNIGSGYCKAGFSLEDTPSVVIPTIVGRPKSQDALPGVSMDTMFVGNDAKLRRESLILSHPMKRGVVEDWDEWLAIVNHVITMELKMELRDACVVIPMSPMTTRESREKIVELMFKNLEVSKLYLGSSAPMALHAFSMTSALLITIGYDVTTCVPVVQGNVCSDAVRVLPLGGKDITERLTALIRQDDDLELKNHNKQDIAKAMMERLCYVSTGGSEDTEIKQRNKRTYSLPSGAAVKLDKERFLAPEILFRPKLLDQSLCDKGLHHVCVESIQACNDAVVDEVLGNVVIVGGTSLLPGLPLRLKNELTNLLPHKNEIIKIQTLPKRQYAIWRGAGRMTSLSMSRHRWIRKSEFDEFGPSIVHRKYV